MIRYGKAPKRSPGEPVRPEHARELVDVDALAEGKEQPLSARLLAAFGRYNKRAGHIRGKGRPKGGHNDEAKMHEAIQLILDEGVSVNKACTIVADRYPEHVSRASTIRRLSYKVQRIRRHLEK